MCVKASEDALLSEPKGSAVANDAKPRAEISSLNLCRGAKEENCKLSDAFIPHRPHRGGVAVGGGAAIAEVGVVVGILGRFEVLGQDL